MIYTDARLSRHFPTIEIRICDVCADARDAVLLAALCRGLVETAAREYVDGVPAPPAHTSLLRLAAWQAGKAGLGGALVDPRTLRPASARAVVDALVEHVAVALDEYGDRDVVTDGVHRLFSRGTGATRQRAVMAQTGRLADVVTDLVRATAGES